MKQPPTYRGPHFTPFIDLFFLAHLDMTGRCFFWLALKITFSLWVFVSCWGDGLYSGHHGVEGLSHLAVGNIQLAVYPQRTLTSEVEPFFESWVSIGWWTISNHLRVVSGWLFRGFQVVHWMETKGTNYFQPKSAALADGHEDATMMSCGTKAQEINNTPMKANMTIWKVPVVNRKYIFKWCFFFSIAILSFPKW